MENLAFHSFTQMKGDYTTNSHHLPYTLLFKRLGECPFLTLGSERVKLPWRSEPTVFHKHVWKSQALLLTTGDVNSVLLSQQHCSEWNRESSEKRSPSYRKRRRPYKSFHSIEVCKPVTSISWSYRRGPRGHSDFSSKTHSIMTPNWAGRQKTEHRVIAINHYRFLYVKRRHRNFDNGAVREKKKKTKTR